MKEWIACSNVFYFIGSQGRIMLMHLNANTVYRIIEYLSVHERLSQLQNKC